eukprot:gene4187-5238_t
MSMFRDLVEGECAEPNALGGFVQNFTSDKSGLYHDKWMTPNMDNELYNMHHGLIHDDVLDQNLDKIYNGIDGNEDVNSMLDRNYMRDQHNLPPGLHEEFQNQNGGGLPMMPEHVHRDLQLVFQDFLMSTKSHNLLAPGHIGHHLNLSQIDKAKIRNRSSVMIRHFTDDKGFTMDQLNNLFNTIGIEAEDDFSDLKQHWREEEDWENDFQQNFQNPHHHGPTTTTTTSTSNKFYDANEERYRNDVPHDFVEEEQEKFDRVWEDEQYDRDYDKFWEEDEGFEPFDNAWENGEFDERDVEAAWDETARKTISDITDPITKINDPKLQKSNFMKFMNQLNRGEARIVNDELVTDQEPFEDQQEEQIGAEEFFNDDWVSGYNNFHQEISQERLEGYQFSIKEARDEDTFDVGIGLFKDGLITDSIIALESEVKRNPENALAWMYLGMAHAENDKDVEAITCLQKSIRLDPNNLQARIALAVSFTNNYQKEAALEILPQWLKNKPEYAHLLKNRPIEEAYENSFLDTWKRHTMTTELFLDAARLRPNDPDPDVQTILGLLFNLSYEYDKAVDCFKAALQNNPTDYQLWNKLGATLANSNRNEEAIGAYVKALEHKPSYVRARSNLGISYHSLKMYNEAAQSFLGALSIHPDAFHIWEHLTLLFREMGREDLVEKTKAQDVSLFVNDFTFM